MILKRSRIFTAATAAALSVFLLAGCTSDGDTDSTGQGNAEVAIGGARFNTADAETAKLGTDAKPGEFPREITHAAGVTTLASKPERVVVLDTGELDGLLALGITPVGMVTTEGASPVPSYLADKVADVPSVGTIQNINLEAVLELDPDVIIGSQLRVDSLYEPLSQIAPTILSIRPGFPWKENFQLLADAVGEEKKATEQLNAYADAVVKLKDGVDGDVQISLVRFMPGKLRLYGNKSLLGVILQDAGLSRPQAQNVDDLAVEISAENIAEAAGDFIFYSSYGAPAATGEDQVVGSAGWRELDAVKAGKSFRVNDDVWYLGLGPIGANQIVQELSGYLA